MLQATYFKFFSRYPHVSEGFCEQHANLNLARRGHKGGRFKNESSCAPRREGRRQTEALRL
jgi:hypothetical protein